MMVLPVLSAIPTEMLGKMALKDLEKASDEASAVSFSNLSLPLLGFLDTFSRALRSRSKDEKTEISEHVSCI